jgi:hypothetical protein
MAQRREELSLLPERAPSEGGSRNSGRSMRVADTPAASLNAGAGEELSLALVWPVSQRGPWSREGVSG